MRNSVFDYIDTLDTLLAVVIGALLATGGALVAELVQDRLGQKRRERDAARFFGEILASVDLILARAFRSLELGERWGDVSQRLFQTALDEAAIYERNRERLFEIRDMELRREIHVHFLTEIVPLTALIDNCKDISALEKELQVEGFSSTEHQRMLEHELAELKDSRERTLDNIRDEHAETEAICKKLEPIAGVSFIYAEPF
ncbi:MAG: hypothetical protein AAF642_04555 [Pseudomonadota bacterium]